MLMYYVSRVFNCDWCVFLRFVDILSYRTLYESYLKVLYDFLLMTVAVTLLFRYRPLENPYRLTSMNVF